MRLILETWRYYNTYWYVPIRNNEYDHMTYIQFCRDIKFRYREYFSMRIHFVWSQVWRILQVRICIFIHGIYETSLNISQLILVSRYWRHSKWPKRIRRHNEPLTTYILLYVTNIQDNTLIKTRLDKTLIDFQHLRCVTINFQTIFSMRFAYIY